MILFRHNDLCKRTLAGLTACTVIFINHKCKLRLLRLHLCYEDFTHTKNLNTIMGMVAISLNDKEYQGYQNELALLQIKEMKDKKRYPDEIEAIKEKIDKRYEWLKNNYS